MSTDLRITIKSNGLIKYKIWTTKITDALRKWRTLYLVPTIDSWPDRIEIANNEIAPFQFIIERIAAALRDLTETTAQARERIFNNLIIEVESSMNLPNWTKFSNRHRWLCNTRTRLARLRQAYKNTTRSTPIKKEAIES